jgi:protein-S-isoprenylcysteine O-methyltransferase Ste14
MTHFEGTCSRMLAYKPPRIAMSLLALATLMQIGLPSDRPQLPSLLIPGLVFAALGFGIMIRAWWLFRQHDTAICPIAESTSFITCDIYATTRNPMYLGMILILLGIALAAGSWPYYVVAGFYALILNHVFCRYEERKLRDQYGAEYVAYAARVRRWI